MSLSKEEEFNEEWRSLFENAEESPSDGLWDSIARRLDEEEAAPIIPLWPRAKPWVYSVAAAVITLLVGWWAMQSINNATMNRPVAGQTTGSSENKTSTTTNRTAEQDNTSAAAIASENPATRQKTEPDADTKKLGQALATRSASAKQTPKPELESSKTVIDNVTSDQSALLANRKDSGSQPALTRVASIPKSSVSQTAQNRQANRAVNNGPLPTEQDRNTTQIASAERPDQTVDTRLAYEASYIDNKTIAQKNPRPISRIVWYRAPEPAIEPQEKERSQKEYWAALTATPMSFNPMTSVQSSRFNQAYASMNGVQQGSRVQNTTPLQNQAQMSMAWQASSGVQLSKHWSVEAGIQYLNGRSQARNNASVTNVFTNQTENMLVNAIRNSSTSLAMDALPQTGNSLLPSGLDKNGLGSSSYLAVIPSDQLISNDFQYFQVPVQVGYHILPAHKISYSVLGGLMANVFLKNTINGTLEVNPVDQIYRPMSLAGTAGLRVNYHPTHHWSGSLTGSYQQSLQNGTQSGTQLQVRPQAVGVGFGLNYHF